MGIFSEWFRHLPMVEIHSQVETSEGVDKKGKAYKRRIQVAYLVQIDEYGVETRRRVRINLDRDQAPYVPGLAVLDGVSLNGNEWGDLELRRFGQRFLPIPTEVMRLIDTDSKRQAA